MQTRTVRSDPADLLSGHIEALQQSLRTLPKSATLSDLARQFTGGLRDIFHGADIAAFHKPARSEEWQSLTGTSAPGMEKSLSVPAGATAPATFFDRDSASMHVIQMLDDRSHIGVALSGKDSGRRYSEVDVVSLRLFVHLFATAYRELLSQRTEKELIFSLNHRVLQLTSLIDTGIEVSKLDQKSSPHRLALERAASLTNASKGVVRVSHGDHVLEETSFPGGEPMPTGVDDARRIAAGFTFGKVTYSFELFEKESRKGIQPFEDTDQLLLDALARQVHASLENRYLLQQALEKEKIEHDLALAASIQQKLLPKSLPVIEGYDIAGINIPTKAVGGDYYDCIPLPDGKYALIIADVAGKGMPAALLVSSLHAYLAAYLETPMPLAQLAQRLNKAIVATSTEDRFITAFIALLSPETGELESLNAAHNPVFWRKHDDSIAELSAGGVAFGMLDIDFPYQTERIALGKGDRLLLYTDGITEATNERNELYDSSAPLRDFVARKTPPRAETFIQELIGDIKKFTENAPQSDDITALYLLRR